MASAQCGAGHAITLQIGNASWPGRTAGAPSDDGTVPVLDGHLLVDAHTHPARLPTLKPAWHDWAQEFGDREAIGRVYDADGTPDPARFGELLDSEGVDIVLMLCEYSPKATGVQPIEDLL